MCRLAPEPRPKEAELLFSFHFDSELLIYCYHCQSNLFNEWWPSALYIALNNSKPFSFVGLALSYLSLLIMIELKAL